MELGQTVNSTEYRYLKRVAQVGLSKDTLSMAKFNLNQCLPVDCNTIAVDSNTTAQNTGLFEADSGLSAMAWLDSTTAAIRRSQAPPPPEHDLI